MRIIESTAGWLGSMLDGLTEMELYELFDEIASSLLQILRPPTRWSKTPSRLKSRAARTINLQRGWA